MPLRLICGPTGSGKTTRAIEAFLAAVDAGHNPLFIAPSRPDARHFQRRILRRLGEGSDNGVLTGGKVGTFEAMYEGVLRADAPGMRVINTTERFLLLRAIVEATGELGGLGRSASFDGFVTALGNLIGELEELGADAAQTGERLRSWASGNRWRQDLNKDLFRLYGKYEAILRDRGLLDPQLALRRTATVLAGQPQRLGRGAVILDGFWDFTPAQHELLQQLAAFTQVVVTVPGGDGRVANAAPAYHLKRLRGIADAQLEVLPERLDDSRVAPLNHLLDNLFEEEYSQAPADGALTRLTAAGIRGQAEAVAAEILRLWRTGEELDQIAVVCRSAGADMQALAATMAEFGVPCEMDAPLPLADTALGRTAVSALDFVAGSRSRDAFFAWLRSPLINLPAADIDNFDLHVRRNGIDTAPDLLMEWKQRMDKPLPMIERLSAAAPKDVGPLGEALCATMRELVDNGGFADATIDSLRQDMLALASLDSICREAALTQEIFQDAGLSEPERHGSLAVRPAAGLLLRTIRTASIREADGTGRGCVRLLDSHRILNQRFDTVFVCGLLEKQFPSFGREDAFFSDADRHEIAAGFGIGLDGRERRLDEERFLFFRNISRARRRIYLCYPSCDKEGKPTVPSLFVSDTLDLFTAGSVQKRERGISDIVFSPSAAPTATQAIRSLALEYREGDGGSTRALLDAAASAGLEERLQACLSLAPDRELAITDPRVRERLGLEHSFRVTHLQQYLRCPFRYFVETVLDPAPLEPTPRGLRRGQVAHDILCHFGAQLNRSQLYLHEATAEQLAVARQQMARFIEEEFIDAGSDLETLILKTELKYHLDRYISFEAAAGRPLKYYDFELGFGSSPKDCGGRNGSLEPLLMNGFELRGRLDRVDWHGANNSALVIDYKTSKSVTSQAKFEVEKEIQIPLYMLALREVFGLTPIGGEYIALRGDKRGGLYLTGNEDLIGTDSGQVRSSDIVDQETFDERLKTAISLTEGAVADIWRGVFPHDPARGKTDCDWCDVGAICRRQSWSPEQAVASDD
ncbi:MAG: PD-(D/E)XK nuclease family protein [Thermoleophilia bacterium]